MILPRSYLKPEGATIVQRGRLRVGQPFTQIKSVVSKLYVLSPANTNLMQTGIEYTDPPSYAFTTRSLLNAICGHV